MPDHTLEWSTLIQAVEQAAESLKQHRYEFVRDEDKADFLRALGSISEELFYHLRLAQVIPANVSQAAVDASDLTGVERRILEDSPSLGAIVAKHIDMKIEETEGSI